MSIIKSEKFQTFIRRFKYYSIGLTIGLLFVFFFFNNRGCSWTPSNRVKDSISTRLLVANDDSFEKLKDNGIDQKVLKQVLLEGDIDFKASQKEGVDKAYLVRTDNHSIIFTLPYESFYSEVFVYDNPKMKVKSSTTGEGNIVFFPENKEIFFLDSNLVLSCQQELLGIKDAKDLYKNFLKSGKVNFEKTNLSIVPKPEIVLTFQTPKFGKIDINTIYYKEKINVSSFGIENKPENYDCE